MRYCEHCGAEVADASRFCESCGAVLSDSALYRYQIVVRCQNAPEIGREEFEAGQRYDDFLRAICNDGAEPDALHEYTGVRQDVTCSSIEIADADGNVVLDCSLDPASAKSGLLRFQNDGDCFDESNSTGKVFLYQLVNWQNQAWSCTLELESPFEVLNLNVRYQAFKDADESLHKAISCFEYDGNEIELDWDGGDGSDDSRCWLLENGVHREVDPYDYDDEGDDDDEYFEDESEDGDVDLSDKGLDPTHGYYMTIDGREATMYMDNGQMIRRFRMRANVVQATTSGETVSIVTDDGYTTLYSWTGQLIRRIRSR